jgi:hypothetical protein
MRKILLLSLFSLFLITCGGGGGGGSTGPTQPQLPTVQNIAFTTPEDIPKTFAFMGSEPQNYALTYSISTQPQHGTVSVSGGAATYTPNANYNGADTFYYLATSISGNSNMGTVVATITAVDDEPNTMDATAVTDEDNAVDITLQFEEVDGDNIQFNVVNNPSNGNVTISGTTATYTPNQDWNGTDTFNFEVVDVSSKSILNTATATITVNPINDAPVANNMSVSTNENRMMQLDITLDVTDVDGDNLTYAIVSGVSDGTTSLSGSTVTYTPNQDWNGTDTFAFKANDGTVDSNIAVVTITVSAINDAPIANDINTSTNRHIPVSITLDATDVENDDLTYSIVSGPSSSVGGSLGDIDGNTVVYTTSNGGTDSFTYKANDGEFDSNTATVNITITSNNNAPTVRDTTFTIGNTRIDGGEPISFFSLPGDDLDAARDNYTNEALLTYTLENNPSGWFRNDGTRKDQHHPNRVEFYVPNGFVGSKSSDFKATDNENADSNIGTITVNTVVASETNSIYLAGTGYSQYLQIPATTTATETTVMMWVKILPFSGGNWGGGQQEMTKTSTVAFWDAATGNWNYLNYKYTTNELVLYKEFINGSSSSTNIVYTTVLGTLNIGEWYHIALTNGYDVNNHRFQAAYINGTLVSINTAVSAGAGSFGDTANSIAHVRVGNDIGKGGNSWNDSSMILDDYATFPTRLSQSDIATYMNNMTTDSNIIDHYYDFNAGSLSDITGNGTDASGAANRHTDSPHN